MFLYKIQGQEVMFKLDSSAIDRLDKEAMNVRLTDEGDAAGIKAYSIIGSMFAILGVDSEKSEEAVEQNLDVTLLDFYFAKIAFALQNKKSFDVIEEFIKNLEDDAYNDFLQKIVEEVRPKKERAISIK